MADYIAKTVDTSSSTVTLGTYLKGQAGGYPITDEAIASIILDYDSEMSIDDDASGLTLKKREILTAKVLLWCADVLPYTTAYTEDVNGVWKHKEGAVTIKDSDRAALRKRAKVLLSKYDIAYSQSSIKMNSLGLKVI